MRTLLDCFVFEKLTKLMGPFVSLLPSAALTTAGLSTSQAARHLEWERIHTMIWEEGGGTGTEVGRRPNLRIKLTACGTRSHGKKRRRSHAAAYPRRWADITEEAR